MMTTSTCADCGALIEHALWKGALEHGRPRAIVLEAGHHRDGNLEVVAHTAGFTPIVRLVPIHEQPGRLLRRPHRHAR